MSEEKKWYRVVDPISPLYGCDVHGCKHSLMLMRDRLVIDAMRRVDMFIGDRPFQLVAPPGEDLGLLIKFDQLNESPLQDEIIELTTTRPFGLCLSESEVQRADGYMMRMAQYERLSQVAIEAENGDLVATATCSQKLADVWMQAFAEDGDIDELIAQMSRRA